MRVITALLTAALLVVLSGFAAIYAGAYDVAATSPHWPVTTWLLTTARTRSIKAHAANIQTPPGLDDPAKVLIGVGHFAAHCAVCHGAPGVPKGDIAQGLYPPPPDLAKSAPLYTPAELFWIVKHGIKMTGMPAWSDHNDDELWATVAFLQKLPGMSEQYYAKLVVASIARGGHHRAGNSITMQICRISTQSHNCNHQWLGLSQPAAHGGPLPIQHTVLFNQEQSVKHSQRNSRGRLLALECGPLAMPCSSESPFRQSAPSTARARPNSVSAS